eukprot:4405313-Ditylum_brightwellii.AAC.1
MTAAGCSQAPPFPGTGKFRERMIAAARLIGFLDATHGVLSASDTESLGSDTYTAFLSEDTDALMAFLSPSSLN